MSFPQSPSLLICPHAGDPSPEHFRERYALQMARLSKQLDVPAPEEIYQPNERRLAARPRLYFGALILADLRAQAVDPRYARIDDYLHKFAAKAVDLVSPAAVDLTTHDPNRSYADSLAWMAASFLVDRDDARRTRTRAGGCCAGSARCGLGGRSTTTSCWPRRPSGWRLFTTGCTMS